MKDKVALMLFGIVIALLTSEIYLRLSFPKGFPVSRDVAENKSISYQPSIFSRHVIEAKDVVLNIASRGVRYRINSLGYRGRYVPFKKEEGICRIMFYGGSSVFDIYADDPNDWPHLTERKLKDLGINVEVINAGVPGHASFDSLGRFLSEGWIFQPDIVLLMNTWNDIKYFTFNKPLLRSFSPYLPLKDPSQHSFNIFDYYAQKYLKSWRIVRYLYISKRFRDIKSSLHHSYNPLMSKQFSLFVSVFVDAVESAGAKPVLLLQPRLVKVNNFAEVKGYVRYNYVHLTHKALVTAFHEAEKIIKKVSEKKRILFIDTSTLNGKLRYFYDHVHLKPSGSQKLANLTANRLKEQFISLFKQKKCISDLQLSKRAK